LSVRADRADLLLCRLFRAVLGWAAGLGCFGMFGLCVVRLWSSWYCWAGRHVLTVWAVGAKPDCSAVWAGWAVRAGFGLACICRH
jgi:hypothetical protein